MKSTIELVASRLKSLTNIKHQRVVFYGDECIATIALKKYPNGRIEPYQLVSTRNRVFKNAIFQKFNMVIWKEMEMELCSIEIILQLIRKYNLWPHVDSDRL